MVEIPLTQGKVAVVDDDDAEEIQAYRWCFYGGYAWRRRRTSETPGTRLISMHRQLLGLANASGAHDVDHRDGDGLNNRRGNLRPATKQQNAVNRRKADHWTSRYIGVHRRSDCDRWAASIRYDDRRWHLGLFVSEEAAGRAYDAAAREHFGAFARLNFGREP